MRTRLAAWLLLIAFAASPAWANGYHRCMGNDGVPVYSDQPCEDIGANKRPELAPTPDQANIGRLHARVCARTVDALAHDMQLALVAHDANQLAAFYHWPGTSNEESEAVFKRLQEIVDRPFQSVAWIKPNLKTE